MPAGVSDIIGIDLGTTFSAVGIWKNGNVEIIASKDGPRITPSCVSYTTEELLVGLPAKKKQVENYQNTIYDMKRLMGKAYDPEIKKKMGWLFDVREGGDSRPLVHVNYKREPFTVSPEGVSALVLKKMKETIERNIGDTVSKAVITVPAYFSQAQRQATINAAKIADLEVMELITEPAAAAYAYGFHNKAFDDHNLLVFDFGGGTFDVVVMKVKNGNFEVISIDGDTQLGGRDIDMVLVEHFADVVKKSYNADVKADNRRRQKFLKEIIELKHSLSSDTTAGFYLGDILPSIEESLDVTREEMNKLCKDVFDRVIAVTRNCVNEAKIPIAQIHKVLLIGGSSRIPKLQELLADIFGKDKLDCSMHPDEAVAYGAAVRAAQISPVTTTVTPNITLLEATPLSLGINITQGRFHVMIPRNATIPCRKTEKKVTAINNQKSMAFKIYEGERPMAEANNKLGEFTLGNLPERAARTVEALLTFDLNKNGILKVSAVHNDLKAECSINYIQTKTPQKNIEDLLNEAKLFKEQDDKVRSAMDAKSDLKNRIEKVKYRIQTEKLQENKKSQLQKAVNEVNEWLADTTSNDKRIYEEKMREFDDLCKPE